MLLDWQTGVATDTLMIDATGEWTIEVMPLTEMRVVDSPGTIDTLVDTTDVYDGIVKVSGRGVLVIRAAGAWSVATVD